MKHLRGNIYSSHAESIKPVPTLFGFCIDIHRLLNIVTDNQSEPSETTVTKESRQLYKRRCLALLKAKAYRSDYWTGALYSNSCSRLLDAVAMGEIPFKAQAESYLDALRALKSVKDKCLQGPYSLNYLT